MKVQMNRKACFAVLIVLAIVILHYWRGRSLELDVLDAEVDIGSARKALSHDKWIVVTTIQHPTPSLKWLADLPDWKVVVIGDTKTPADWSLNGVIYLSLAAQKRLDYRVLSYLPYGSYTRKIIGYLYAIENGAQYIYETDDDNYITDFDIFITKSMGKALVPVNSHNTYNPYVHFGQSSMWPRGYPLESIGLPQSRQYQLCTVITPAVQQGLVNGDPDVDAIFRMTRKSSNVKLNITFDTQAPPVVLPYGVFAPYNSQNTFYNYRAFWSLILFTSLSDRETDIYRSYWAQRLLWLSGNYLAYQPPTSFQERNLWHTNNKDARAEVKLYTEIEEYVKYLHRWTCSKPFFFDCMTDLTSELVTLGFVQHSDAQLLSAWIDDLAAHGYSPPLIRETKKTCEKFDAIDVIYYPVEQNTSMSYTQHLAIPPEVDGSDVFKKTARSLCGTEHEVHITNAMAVSQKFDDVLLVISVTGDLEIIPTLNTIYRIHFTHILYCGSWSINRNDVDAWKVTYVQVKDVDILRCIDIASSMHYNVAGYLHISQNTFMRYELMHVSTKNKNQVWISGADLYIFNEDTLNMCASSDIQCAHLDQAVFTAIGNKLKELYPGARMLDQFMTCLAKAGKDPTFKGHEVIASKEMTFYLPKSKVKTFQELTTYFLGNSFMKSYSFLALVIMECIDAAPEYLHSVAVRDVTTNDHYDYIFPFLFSKLRSNSSLRDMYCNYIKQN